MAAKKMAIIATKGALDMAYPPLILASTAAALGWEVQVFFTFYGLQLLRKDLSGIAISPLANPAMPMPVPMPSAPQATPDPRSLFMSFVYSFKALPDRTDETAFSRWSMGRSRWACHWRVIRPL